MCMIGGRVGNSHSGIHSVIRYEYTPVAPEAGGEVQFSVSQEHGQTTEVVHLGGDEEGVDFVKKARMMLEVF